MALAIVACAICIYATSVYRLTGHLQLYATKMSEKAGELEQEKLKTNKLLYQMLPETVAEQLKANKVSDFIEKFLDVIYRWPMISSCNADVNVYNIMFTSSIDTRLLH